MRYLGVLYHLAKRSMVRKAIFREICVRVIKNALRQRLRQVSLIFHYAAVSILHLFVLLLLSKCEHLAQL